MWAFFLSFWSSILVKVAGLQPCMKNIAILFTLQVQARRENIIESAFFLHFLQCIFWKFSPNFFFKPKDTRTHTHTSVFYALSNVARIFHTQFYPRLINAPSGLHLTQMKRLGGYSKWF